jgi:CRISPR-associated protein Cmr2
MMSTHLLALSIGPVQGFIAAARRTRDLWCGSMILSEVSKAAARAVAEAGGMLIFPALEKGDAELGRNSEFNVANIILAELPEEIDEPDKVAEKAEAAALSRWKNEARKAVPKAGAFVNQERCNQQIEDVIEFYSAWAPVNGDYQASRQRVMRLLAGRKTCRDFKPETIVARVPKSSLDGARDMVWKDEVWKSPEKFRGLNRALERRLRLSEGEQLDAVGLTKRLAFGKQAYPSVSRIAADPWLRGLADAAKRNPAVLKVNQELKEICEHLTTCGLGPLAADRFPQFSDFPFEGTAVYRTRYKELKFEIGDDEQAANLVDKLGKKVSDLAGKLGEPEPYLAILKADGDHMGKVISQIESPEEHREFSRMLAQFAGAADKIVKSFYGCLVYSGGTTCWPSFRWTPA